MSQYLQYMCDLFAGLFNSDIRKVQLKTGTMCPPRRWQTLWLRCHMDLQGIQKNSATKWLTIDRKLSSNILNLLETLSGLHVWMQSLLLCIYHPIPAPKTHWKLCPSNLTPTKSLLQTQQSLVTPTRNGHLLLMTTTQKSLPHMQMLLTMTKTTVVYGCQAMFRTKDYLCPP